MRQQTRYNLSMLKRFKLPETIPDSFRAEHETTLGFRGRCTPADLWPSFKEWLVKEGLEIHCKRAEEEEDV